MKALDQPAVKNKYAPELQVLFETQAEFEISGRTLKSGQATANSVGVESIENFDKNAKCISENLAALEI